jgi:hypothetical protein
VTRLGVDGPVRGTAREFAFHGGEDGFDQRALSISFCGKFLPDLELYTRYPATGAALGRDCTFGPELLAAEGVVALRIELGSGQNATYQSLPMRLCHEHRQSCGTFISAAFRTDVSRTSTEPVAPYLLRDEVMITWVWG